MASSKLDSEKDAVWTTVKGSCFNQPQFYVGHIHYKVKILFHFLSYWNYFSGSHWLYGCRICRIQFWRLYSYFCVLVLTIIFVVLHNFVLECIISPLFSTAIILHVFKLKTEFKRIHDCKSGISYLLQKLPIFRLFGKFKRGNMTADITERSEWSIVATTAKNNKQVMDTSIITCLSYLTQAVRTMVGAQ